MINNYDQSAELNCQGLQYNSVPREGLEPGLVDLLWNVAYYSPSQFYEHVPSLK